MLAIIVVLQLIVLYVAETQYTGKELRIDLR